MKARILVVEDDPLVSKFLTEPLTALGHDVITVESAEAAADALEQNPVEILITDVNLPGKSGLEVLPLCRQLNPQAHMLVMTGFGTIETAVRAMKLGAADFLCKPISVDTIETAVKVGVEKLSKKPRATRWLPDSPIIARSQVMLDLLKQVETIAPFKLNVLITGETGTGKELISRSIHDLGPRAKGPFVALNCAAVPEQLLEDELFGHVKGAFTGAQTERKGRFEQADGGTLFLDEIGDMNLALQSKLLRILQESEFERVGSSKTIKVDVRVVAATSANLEAKIADGSFRADLFHRLNVVRLSVPPLRDRPDDIVSLAHGLLARFCEGAGLPEKTVADEAYHALISYSFPGNVRQLQNCMERAAVFSGAETVIRLAHLPDEIRNQANLFQIPASTVGSSAVIPDEGLDFSSYVSGIERELLLRTLDKTGGNKMQAAKLLNMKRTTLVEKIKRLNIETAEEAETEEAAVAAGDK